MAKRCMCGVLTSNYAAAIAASQKAISNSVVFWKINASSLNRLFEIGLFTTVSSNRSGT